jgi:branched-chain amino acid aminotransferase
VIKLAKQLNIPVHERKIDKAIISEADEVFLTGTASEITPVSKIDNHIYLQKEVTRSIMSEFYDFVYNGKR